MPPLALTDSQIRAVMATAAVLDHDFGRALTRAPQGLQQGGHGDAA
jgi:hypothetical protein